MLKELYEGTRSRELSPSIQVVVIPSPGLTRPTAWGHGGGLWLRTLLSSVAPQARGYEYIYDESNVASTADQRLIEEGHALLDQLSRLVEDFETLPLIFICHSLGGFVLKKALCIAREQHYSYRPLIDVISGVVFLGAPHLLGSSEEAKKTLRFLLKCQQKSWNPNSSNLDAQVFTKLCVDFEHVKLMVPIISAYESKGTQTSKIVFSKFRRETIICPESLCSVNAHDEKRIDSELNHLEICNVRESSLLFAAISRLFADVEHNGSELVEKRRREYIVAAGLRDESLRSHSVHPGMKRTGTSEQKSDLLKIPSQRSVPSPARGTDGSTAPSIVHVAQHAAFEPTSKNPHLPCFQLGTHERVDSFFGREDILKQIDEYLLPQENEQYGEGSKNLQSFALCGMGGLGKTQTAVEYIHTRKLSFEAVFWVVADNPEILAESFGRIAQQLGLEDPDDGSADLTASRELVKGWLSNPVRKFDVPDSPSNSVHWLIVFDNVSDLDVLSDYWPATGHGSILVTSRDPFTKIDEYTVKHGVDLQPLSAVDTQDMLQKLTRLKIDVSQQQALSAVSEKLGGLPLAISQMAGVIRSLRMTYSDFLEFWDTEGIAQLERMQPSSTTSDRARSLATVWALDRLSDATTALLQILSFLDPDSIPEHILLNSLANNSLPAFPKTRSEYFTARAQLLSSSLVSHNDGAKQLSLHRLIQDTTREMIRPENLLAIVQEALNMVVMAWPFQLESEYHSNGRFIMCASIFPCILRLKGWIEKFITEMDYYPGVSFAKLMNDTGWYLFERGQIAESKPYYSLALKVSDMAPSKDTDVDYNIRRSHYFLGCAHAETNYPDECLRHQKIWIDMLSKRTTSSGTLLVDYELAVGYNELGVAYGMNHMWETAEQCFVHSIDLHQGLEDYKDTMLGWPEPNLGLMYWVQGQLEDAERVLLEILDIYAAAYGVDDTESFKTGKILYCLGNVMESQQRFDESFDYHSRSLKQYRKTLGDSHHRTGDVCYRLAGHYSRMNIPTEAETYINQSEKIFSSRSHYEQELARTKFRRSKILRALGREKEADQAASHALELRKRIVPKDTRPLESLSEVDFDNLVIFWSR